VLLEVALAEHVVGLAEHEAYEVLGVNRATGREHRACA
jgi:hypothetical protein